MSNEFNIFFSNQLDILYLDLKKNLFNNTSPFTRRLVIVYGPAMKSWLTLKMASDPDLKIVFGLEFIYLTQAFESLIKILNPSEIYKIPTSLDLALAIEHAIMQILESYETLPDEEKDIWKPLIGYFKFNTGSKPISLSLKSEKRLNSLSRHLAKLFLNYSRFADKLVEKWEKEPATHWQQQLWKNLFRNRSPRLNNINPIQQLFDQTSNLQIHFFSISFLSHTEFAFIEKFSQSIPIFYYLISPCAVFWSDIKSDKESRFIQRFYEKQFGQFSPQTEQLEELLRDRNPLLANFGRMGREMVVQIEESSALCRAYYVLPNHVEARYDIGLCENLYLYEDSQPPTLLNAVQADMLLMRTPDDHEVYNFDTDDCSIQLHVAPDRGREVEILYHNLLALMRKHPELEPRDIIVMAPQIHDYIPYVKSRFGSEDSLIDFQILDLGAESTSEIVQAFLLLLKTGDSRWDAANLLQLFEQPSFRRKTHFSQADCELIRDWTEQAGIRWGNDRLHRNDLLKRRHCRYGMTDETSVGTWDYGLSRLLLGLTNLLHRDSPFPLDTHPCSSVDFTDTELLSKWIKLLHSLRDDLTPLHDGTKMSANDWGLYFKSLLENYFQADFEDNANGEEFSDLQAQLELLGSSARACKSALFPFTSMHAHLKNLLGQTGMIFRENYLQTVRFCSLIPLRSIPAKVIALLGMQEDVFPRPEEFSSLNLANLNEAADYCPSSIDYDRFLFLEALHSTRDYLLISYQGRDQNDNKEQSPSIVVQELFSYLDRHYLIQGEKVSEHCSFNHPLDAFDEHYFLSGSRLFNFSQNDYRTAEIFYNSHRQKRHSFITDFEPSPEPLSEILPNGSLIDIKHLTEVARDPIKFHLRRVLNIYLQDSRDRILKNEEDIKISTLDKHHLKQIGLKFTTDRVISQAEKEGKLPFGIFKTVAVNHLSKDLLSIQERLKAEAVSQDQIVRIEFSQSVQTPIRLSDGNWRFPAITLHYSEDYQLHIVGTLSQVTPKGLFVLAKDKLEDLWKTWPGFLVYLYACRFCPEKFERNLILSEAKKSKAPLFDDPEPYLKQFIRYYALCRRNFSPLMPQWLDPIFKKDVESLQKELNRIYEEGFGAYKSFDLQWVFNKQRLPNAQDVLNAWENEAAKLISDLNKVF